MSPTDNLEGNTVVLQSPVAEDFCQPSPTTSTLDLVTSSNSIASSTATSNLSAPDSFGEMQTQQQTAGGRDAKPTGWRWSRDEKADGEPVSLLSYNPIQELSALANPNARRDQLERNGSIPDDSSVPRFLPVHLNGTNYAFEMDAEMCLRKSDPSIIDSEKAMHIPDGIIILGDISDSKYSKEKGLQLLPSTHSSNFSLPTSNSTASLVHDSNGSAYPPPQSNGPSDVPSHSLGVHEPIWSLTAQVFFPYMIAGLGMVGAGLVLDQVQHWAVFKEVTGIYIVIPPLLGLKGNLEMTLASRLSTLANLGSMDSRKSKFRFIGGNMVISQCLASVIGFITSLLAVLIGSLEKGYFHLNYSLVLVASSVATAAASSCVLDSIMVLVILLSRRFQINPDNVATPIAASLGDITTIGLLSGISALLYNSMVAETIVWVGPLVTMSFLILVPLWIYIATRQPYTLQALKTTWPPVLLAMKISTIGGFILNTAVKIFTDIAVFQPIINGVGGNLVAIQASRISTSLHKETVMGVLPPSHTRICISPLGIFLGKESHVRTARLLLFLVFPGQVIFIYLTTLISTGAAGLTFSFVACYLLAAALQVWILLYVAALITYLVWKFSLDPDNITIPLLTALGDLLGIALLFIAFLFLLSIGERVDFINDTGLVNATMMVANITDLVE